MIDSLSRIGAMVMRHYYLLRNSLPRATELIFWASLEVAIWGFMSLYLTGANGELVHAGQFVLAGALLWVALSRSGTAFMISFMEEIWSRNFGHLFVTPLRTWEFTVSLMVISALRMLVGLLFATLFAILVFHSEIMTLGWALALHVLPLVMMSWIFGMLIISTIFRFGVSAEWFGWMFLFVMAPISCIYYPLTALPHWAQVIAVTVPATHVFEAMRGQFITGTIQWAQLGLGYLLDLIYLFLASLLLNHAMNYARSHAMLVQQGE